MCTAVVDIQPEPVVDLRDLNPLRNEPQFCWRAVVGMLVLAFPEIQWVLANQPGVHVPSLVRERGGLTPNHLGTDYNLEPLLRLQDYGFSPLFDGPGFVSAIREGVVAWGPAARNIPVRQSRAVAIDDETPYAYLNAYATYRKGSTCYLVSTYKMMELLFKDSNGQPPVDLSFEDLFLGFPDMDSDKLAERLNLKPSALHLSELVTRDRAFPGLADVRVRAFVTVGHEHVSPGIVTSNKTYRGQKERHCGGGGRVRFIEIRKPVGGIFELQNAIGADGPPPIVWPPVPANQDTTVGHSAPGRLLVVAQRLAQRAARILSAGPITPEQALYGAVLAMNSKEYLQHRTPTASLEALALQQELEVVAECMFHGVAYNRELEPRFEDIATEVHSASYWFAEQEQTATELNARITILGKLAARFREFNRIDEELDCLNEVRKLHPELWRIQRVRSITQGGSARTIGKRLVSAPACGAIWLGYGAYCYASKFMSSLATACLFLAAWIGALGIGFAVLQHPKMHCIERLGAGLGDAVISFFGLGPPAADMQWWAWAPVFVAILVGFPHLGLVVAYLFSRLVRR
jgi:hypothetical protein